MKFARSKKVKIKLTVLIVISLILLTACGAQPTTEPTQTPTTAVLQAIQIVQPTGIATATNTPPPPASPTPNAWMKVEQQKAYLEAHKIPYIVKPNGDLQFDFMKMYTNPEEIQTVAPETLGADLAAAAAECDAGFPEPVSYNPDAYTLVRWGAIPDDDQQQTLYQPYIISDDFAETISPGEPLCVRTTTIEGEPFAFFYMRSPLTDPEQIKQNNGKAFITYWIMASGYPYGPESSHGTETLPAISNGRYQFCLSNIMVDPEVLKAGSEPDIKSKPALLYINKIWHALHANFDAPDGKNMLRLQSDELLQPLLAGKGFTADMQDGIFFGFALRPPDVRERAFVEALPFKVQP